ncbi:hypothetical protein BTA51_26025 [Hahella sp. CCB-MM4]|uniref:major capsid protein n=1 Tax=Hahella sp. (strain CCB-MM4) TaxID=1926491 RepID=UPI000B9A65F1|nr:major capsid protein [Hahella sp. CCB-MM4]OZG70417.1 hypothetical protein BTA51_25965 [Hahella sp. CCB-MM4]OZG70429.1 hypothetical protein BTA51_26025 [Hahella sp. CCB-MM4]
MLKVKEKLNNTYLKTGIAVAGFAANAPVFAADGQLDTTSVQAGIDAAKATGLSVGAMVVAAVASMVVVGIVIGLVKKI